VNRWNKRVEELDRIHDVPPEVDIHREEGIHSTAGRAVEITNNNAMGVELG
jgi:hypothetical protein